MISFYCNAVFRVQMISFYCNAVFRVQMSSDDQFLL